MGDDPPTARLYYGLNVLDGLRQLPDGSIHTVCTSPPYWGLRDYGVPPQHWPEVRFSPLAGVPELVTGLQTIIEGLLFQVLDVDIDTAHIVEASFQLVAFIVLFWSVVAHKVE